MRELKLQDIILTVTYRSYPGTIFSPGIMGWYSFVPFMECKHGIVSINHDLTG